MYIANIKTKIKNYQIKNLMQKIDHDHENTK
jgi:hypothetical protein